MKPATAVFCGLIRDPGMMFLQLVQLQRFQAEGLIGDLIFSTWKGEIDRNPEVWDALNKFGAHVIESDEPQIKTPGHVLHQSKALALALAACPDEGMVLKFRPDVMLLDPRYDRVLSGEVAERHERRVKPTLFQRPVWINSGMPFYPFYFNDIVFYGQKEDLQKLSAVDVRSELFYSGMMPEQFFHLAPVLDGSPLLRSFARIQRPMVAGDALANRDYGAMLLKSPFWHRVWAQFMSLLIENYDVGFSHDDDVFGADTLKRFSRFQLEDLLYGKPEMPGISYYPVAEATLFESAAWAHAAREGRFTPSAASELLQDALGTRAVDLHVSDNPIYPDPDAQALARSLDDRFGDYQPRISMAASPDRRHVINDASGQLTAMGAGDELRALREQVNQLRRDNEGLIVRLSQASGG